MNLNEVLPPQFRKIERDSDRELYLSCRTLRKDWEIKYPWYVIDYVDRMQATLDARGVDCKVTLGRNLEATYMLIQHPRGAEIKELYVGYLSTLESEDLGKPVERLVSSVGRSNKHGEKVKSARLVIEGFQLEQLGLDIGDKCDLYIVPSTDERIGFMRIVPQKRLR